MDRYGRRARRLTSCPADAYDASGPVKERHTAPLPLTHPPNPVRMGCAVADLRRLMAPSQSPRRLVGGLDKCTAFAPQGRGRNGVRPSQIARRSRLGRLRQQAVRAIGQTRSVCPQGRAADGAAASHPIGWSREYNDSELDPGDDNYRHDNPADGRWTGRGLITEQEGLNLYDYAANNGVANSDQPGLWFGQQQDFCCSKCRETMKEKMNIDASEIKAIEDLCPYIRMQESFLS